MDSESTATESPDDPASSPRLAEHPRTVTPLAEPFGSRPPDPTNVYVASERALQRRRRRPVVRVVAAFLVLVALGLIGLLIALVVRNSTPGLPRPVEALPAYGTVLTKVTVHDGKVTTDQAVACDATCSMMSMFVTVESSHDVGRRVIITGNDVSTSEAGSGTWTVQRNVNPATSRPTHIAPTLYSLSFFVPDQMRKYVGVTGAHDTTVAGHAVTEYSLNVNTSAFEAEQPDAYEAWSTRTGSGRLTDSGRMVLAVDEHGTVWSFSLSGNLGVTAYTVTVVAITPEPFVPRLPAV